MTISNKKEQQYISLIKKNKLKFKDIPEEEQTYQMCLEAIKRKSSDLQFIKDEFKTDELFLEGFKNDHILWLNIKNPSEEMCLEAIREHCFSIIYLKPEYVTKEMSLMANLGFPSYHSYRQLRTLVKQSLFSEKYNFYRLNAYLFSKNN